MLFNNIANEDISLRPERLGFINWKNGCKIPESSNSDKDYKLWGFYSYPTYNENMEYIEQKAELIIPYYLNTNISMKALNLLKPPKKPSVISIIQAYNRKQKLEQDKKDNELDNELDNENIPDLLSENLNTLDTLDTLDTLNTLNTLNTLDTVMNNNDDTFTIYTRKKSNKKNSNFRLNSNSNSNNNTYNYENNCNINDDKNDYNSSDSECNDFDFDIHKRQFTKNNAK